MSTNTEDEILTTRTGASLQIVLNRPAALNALSHHMIRQLAAVLDASEADASLKYIYLMGAGGKAFCAGGDIKATYISRADVAANDAYFRDEYRLNKRLYHYSKPTVALMDGITMGGGYGVAGYCAYKIATENTRWAMPETGIGFFPDVGVTYELSRMPGGLGMFLALTGITVNGPDAYAAGIATHYVAAADMPQLKEDLAAGAPIETLMERYNRMPEAVGPVTAHHDVIARCFTRESVHEIFAALAAETAPWAAEILALLHTRSPLSLAVTFERMKRAADSDFDQVIEEDYVIARQFMRGQEFFEGVRAMLIHKDKAPRWSPETIEKVTESAVLAVFAPLPGGLS